ncbi:MAG: hypothetical protein VKJ24_06605 [Synechococcales bacterium]|nr:hypothetical protein [Synechococcales bacterium]
MIPAMSWDNWETDHHSVELVKIRSPRDSGAEPLQSPVSSISLSDRAGKRGSDRTPG